MKEAIIHPGPRVEIKESPIPTPNASQVVIKVVFSVPIPRTGRYGYHESPPKLFSNAEMPKS